MWRRAKELISELRPHAVWDSLKLAFGRLLSVVVLWIYAKMRAIPTSVVYYGTIFVGSLVLLVLGYITGKRGTRRLRDELGRIGESLSSTEKSYLECIEEQKKIEEAAKDANRIANIEFVEGVFIEVSETREYGFTEFFDRFRENHIYAGLARFEYRPQRGARDIDVVSARIDKRGNKSR